MKKIVVHHMSYRLLAPVFIGVLAYVLILMVFDSIFLLQENFFSQEAAFCVGLAYLLNESLRITVLYLDRWFPLYEKAGWRIFIYSLVSLSYAVTLVSAALWAYYHFLVGFQVSVKELLTFNGIYSVFTLLFVLTSASMILLNRRFEEKIEEEELLRAETNRQLQRFKHTINPELFYESFESLITLVKNEPEKADRFISQLSALYRYTLQNQNEDLIGLGEEVDSCRYLLHLLNVRYEGNVCLDTAIDPENLEYLMVPGTLIAVLEQIVTQTIINRWHPLRIQCYAEEQYLVFQYTLNERLNPATNQKFNKEKVLQSAYSYFTDQPLIKVKAYGECFIKIPLLEEVVN